ncbi:hypothetical protein Syun_007187 [Stephania yunnanensis]|uniref:Uncharacterized protein n=1 Tax=Stephania yunnanensis TaxID=152371 RepID=A0AAP0KYB6_9MAGN
MLGNSKGEHRNLGTRFRVSKVQLGYDKRVNCMARSKTRVTREEDGVEVSMGNRGRGSRRPLTASYRKEQEKEKVDVKEKGKIAGNRAKNLQLHDEGSNIDTRRQRDLVIARGEDEAHTSESSTSDSSALADTTSTNRNMGRSTNGGGGHNEGESQGHLEMCAPFPGGPIDESLLKSFKDHVALAIWSNEERLILKCINHNAQIQEWDLQSCHPDTKGLQMIIQRSGVEYADRLLIPQG